MTTAIRNTEHYFGACPECGETDGYMNVGKDHWNVCERHKTCWPIGANLFSSWEEERQEDWDCNAEKLSGYHRVEPLKMAG